MSAAAFDLRWNRILRSREEGYEELMDHLGRSTGLGPLVRLGLLRRREVWSEFQRYHGYIPTEKGDAFMVYIPEKELILVRPGRSAALYSEVKKDPKPDALFKPTYAEPTAAQFAAVEELRDQAGRDVWKAQRADHLRECLLQGFMDFRSLTKRTGVGEGALLRTGLCVPKEERAHEHALSLGLSAEGSRYLHIAEPWALLLVKPGMELPLFERCDPAKAEYWCTLP